VPDVQLRGLAVTRSRGMFDLQHRETARPRNRETAASGLFLAALPCKEK
jgi:hypothetical protein